MVCQLVVLRFLYNICQNFVNHVVTCNVNRTIYCTCTLYHVMHYILYIYANQSIVIMSYVTGSQIE